MHSRKSARHQSELHHEQLFFPSVRVCFCTGFSCFSVPYLTIARALLPSFVSFIHCSHATLSAHMPRAVM